MAVWSRTTASRPRLDAKQIVEELGDKFRMEDPILMSDIKGDDRSEVRCPIAANQPDVGISRNLAKKRAKFSLSIFSISAAPIFSLTSMARAALMVWRMGGVPARFTGLGAGLVQPLFCQRRYVDADDLLELFQSSR